MCCRYRFWPAAGCSYAGEYLQLPDYQMGRPSYCGAQRWHQVRALDRIEAQGSASSGKCLSMHPTRCVLFPHLSVRSIDGQPRRDGQAPGCSVPGYALRVSRICAGRLPSALIKVVGKSDTSGTNLWLTSYLQTGGTSTISPNASVLWPACVQHVAATTGMRTALRANFTLGCAHAAVTP